MRTFRQTGSLVIVALIISLSALACRMGFSPCCQRVALDDADLAIAEPSTDIIALDEALGKLAEEQPAVVELVKLRYFAGLTIEQAAEILEISRRTAEWIFGPKASYEREGDVDDVVFSCGWTVKDDAVNMYYGAADSCIALATGKLSELIDFVLASPDYDPSDWWKSR